MGTLLNKSNEILNEKNSKIIPENIKSGVQIFDITGTYEGDLPEYKSLVVPTNSIITFNIGLIKDALDSQLTNEEKAKVLKLNSSFELCLLFGYEEVTNNEYLFGLSIDDFQKQLYLGSYYKETLALFGDDSVTKEYIFEEMTAQQLITLIDNAYTRGSVTPSARRDAILLLPNTLRTFTIVFADDTSKKISINSDLITLGE